MLNKLTMIGLLVLTFSLTAVAQLRDPAAQPFERGVQRLQKQDLDGAIAEFTKVIELNISRRRDDRVAANFDSKADRSRNEQVTLVSPLVAAAYGSRGLARYRKGLVAEGIADCDRALALNPGLTQVHTNRGLMLWLKGDLDGAFADFSRVIKVQPNNAQAYDNRGNLLFDKGKFAEAWADFDQAIKLDPRNATFYASRGQVLQQLNELERALADCDQAIALNPTFARGFYCRATALYAGDNLEGAATAFRKAIEYNPAMAEAHGNLGWVLRKLGKEAEAEAAFAECVRLDPSARGKIEARKREAGLRPND